jgi:Na+-translocating ferredoxin:NAD+ oxidoreductase RnfA subunit
MGLGAREIWREKTAGIALALLEALLLFVSVLALWWVFALVLTPLNAGFARYFALFPMALAVCSFIEWLVEIVAPLPAGVTKRTFLFPVESGLTVAATLLTLNLADNMNACLALDAGFATGVLVSTLIARAVQTRIADECPAGIFRGLPLHLITLGVLSLVAMGTAVICLGGAAVF